MDMAQWCAPQKSMQVRRTALMAALFDDNGAAVHIESHHVGKYPEFDGLDHVL